MTDTSQSLPNEIRNRYDNSVIYKSNAAKTIKDTLVEAVESGAYLGDAYLGDAYLGDANLRGACLRGACLRGANLRGAYLGDANLRGACLRGACLGDANLRGACLGDAYLGDAYLGDANLGGANLRGACLRGACLRGAYLGDACLGGAYLGDANLGDDGKILSTASVQFTGHGVCGRNLLAVQAEKTTRIFCGCFNGTPDELRAWIDCNEAIYRKTRTLALDTALMLLSVENDTAEDLEKAKEAAQVVISKTKAKRKSAVKKMAKKATKKRKG